ncbi:ETS homologous factor isoform X2 [Salmo salar]|uniref:ETS homologous factor n=1 Tax=Salmo salar TaxID=8030 RepID=A0A1S3MM31_SALSA|nr:ETS homologous factor-like isoform X2 [Salmo salar]|eukprot:XP_014003886.1 PREDICTED: ETS homologous factor-like isoform X2 [Salmo salar]
MVRHTTCIMSIPSTASIESQLPTTWSSYPCPDISTVMPGYTSRLWSQDYKPQYWSKYLVWQWLQQMVDMHQIDAASIHFQNFDVDGRQLCSMTYQDFTRAAGTMGPILYQSLNELKWSGQYPGVEFNPLNIIKSELDDLPCPFPEPSIYPADTKGSHIHPHQIKKHNPRGTHLWEFIRDILLNPERNAGLLKWEDRTDGVFRFLKSEAVAQLWGKKKNNSSMTYEKLSRAMRYYYKREILEHVDGRRLVYKFGKNAQGWRVSEK